MSDDNHNSESFDFDFDALNQEDSPGKTAEPFDLDNPFGDDIVVQRGVANPDDVGMNADGAYFGDAFSDSATSELEVVDPAPDAPVEEETTKKKKGVFGGKGKTKKEKIDKRKKEKPVKEKFAREGVPHDLGAILCVVFSLFLLVSLLVFNIAVFFSEGESLMQKLCFLGAFNLVGLSAVTVPILLYMHSKERTLPNVLLGVAAFAMLAGVESCVIGFYRYSFIMSP